MRKNFAPYLSYKRDNNELLLFALRALSRDTAAYMRNRYGTEQEVIEIAEGDLLDKVRALMRYGNADHTDYMDTIPRDLVGCTACFVNCAT